MRLENVFNIFPNLFHYCSISLQKVISAHSRFSGNASSYYNCVRVFISSYLFVPVILTLDRSIGDDSVMSSALPCGIPSLTSSKITSPSSLSAIIWARVPPMFPAPIKDIFFFVLSFSTPLYLLLWLYYLPKGISCQTYENLVVSL